MLRRLKFFVNTVQARNQNASIKSQYSWWPLNGSNATREPFSGFSTAMTLSNQLGISDDSLCKALEGNSKITSERSLNKTMTGSFVFRQLGSAKCVAVTSKEGESAWADSPDAVPTTAAVVGKECSMAKQLRQSIVRKPIASRRVLDTSGAAKDNMTGSGARPSPSKNIASIPKRIDPEKGMGDGITVGKTNRRELLHAMISVSSKAKIVQEVEQLINLYESERSQLLKTIANLEIQNARCITEAQEAQAAEAILALASNACTATNDETVIDLTNNDATVTPDRTDNETTAEEVTVPDQVDAAAATALRRLFTGNESTKSKHDGNQKVDLIELPSGQMFHVPCLYEVNSKKKITKLKKLAETGRKLENGLNHGRFKGTELGKRLLAAGLAHAPQLTQSAGEMIVPCVISSFLADCGITADPAKVATISPGKRTLGEVIKECGIELVCNLREKLEPVEWLFISCDKGNKSNDNFFVKILCWWNEADKKVEKIILDVDAADGKSADAAKSIDASLCKVNREVTSLV